jgi:hypothetical protein
MSEKYLTLATWGLVAATSFLVLATLLLYLDGRTKAQEQRKRWEKEDKDHEREQRDLRERWKREDELRNQQQEIKYRFGLEFNEDNEIACWIANLGLTSFFVGKLWLDATDVLGSTPLLSRQKGFRWNVVIPAGTAKTFVLPGDFSLGVPQDAEGYSLGTYSVCLDIEHLDRQFRTPQKRFDARIRGTDQLQSFSMAANE